MEITRALATGRRLLREHGLDDWTIVADRAKTRAGVCRYSRREIGISGPLTTLHDESEVLDTILHEIAHALVGPRHGHRERGARHDPARDRPRPRRAPARS
jgi:hypothetical protein